MDERALAMSHEVAESQRASTLMTGELLTRLPRIDVRVVVFTISHDDLTVALEASEAGEFRLLRGPATRRDSLDADASSIVRQQIGSREHYLEQLYTIGAEEHGQWTLMVAYLALIRFDREPAPTPPAIWFGVRPLPPLGPVDRMLVDYAVVRLRAKIGYTTIAFHLLPKAFTLPELQATYETILGQTLDKRNFRRRVIAAGFLEPTGDKRRDGSHRPAMVYRFRASHDQERYLTPAWASEADRDRGNH